VFEDKNALPSAKLHFSIINRHCLTRSRQHHSYMRGHVIAALGPVSEVIGVFRNETIEELLEVMSRGRIGILHNDHAATGVLNKYRYSSIADAAFVDLRLDIVSDFVRALAVSANSESFLMNAHWICGTKITSPETIVAH
jgi:hypothetical protein